jgi:hypothetical protein
LGAGTKCFAWPEDVPGAAIEDDIGGDDDGGERGEETRRSKQLTEASDLLQTIIDEVGREHFIEEAARIVEEEEEEEEEERDGGDGLGVKGRSGESLSRIARKVVKVYMDKLDNVFLASLLAYIQAAKEQNKQDVVELLHCLYEQIILLLREDLPSGVQMVDILTQVVAKKDRTNVMKKGLEKERKTSNANEKEESDRTMGSSLDVPPCNPSEVFGACQEMLGQMEKQEAFDTLLYYRVCCIREEARDFASSSETGGIGLANVYSHALPPSELALVKELLCISDELRVSALLQKSFAELDGLLQQSSSSPQPVLSPFNPNYSKAPQGGSSSSDSDSSAVSPHRFLECLAALVYESELEGNQRFDGGKGAASRPSPKVVRQLKTIRTSAMNALYELAQLKPT